MPRPVGFKHTEKTKRKIGRANKGKTSWHKGRTGVYSEATLKKMSKFRKEWYKTHPPQRGMLGKKHSEEAKRKISENHRGMSGMHHSEETKRKMSEAKSKWHRTHSVWNKGKKGVYSETVLKTMGRGAKEWHKTHSQKGDKNPNWNGGKIRPSKFCYILIHKSKHPFRILGKYVTEHRLVMEKHLGRYLTQDEVVHHINGVKDDNRIENLQLFPNQSEHTKFHNFHRKPRN